MGLLNGTYLMQILVAMSFDSILPRLHVACFAVATLGLYLVSASSNAGTASFGGFSSNAFGLVWSAVAVNLISKTHFFGRAGHVARAIGFFLVLPSYSTTVCIANNIFAQTAAVTYGMTDKEIDMLRAGTFFLLCSSLLSFLLVAAGRPLSEYGTQRFRTAAVQSGCYVAAAVLFIIASILQWSKTKANICVVSSNRITNDLMVGLMLIFGVFTSDPELLDLAFVTSVGSFYTGFVNMESMITGMALESDKQLTKGQMALIIMGSGLVILGAVYHSAVNIQKLSMDATRTRSFRSIAMFCVWLLGVIGAALVYSGAKTTTAQGRVSIWLATWGGIAGPIVAWIAYITNLPGLALVNAVSTLIMQPLLRTLSSSVTDLNNRSGVQLIMAASFTGTVLPLMASMESISLAEIVNGKGPGMRVLSALVLLFIGVAEQYRASYSTTWMTLLQVIMGFSVVLGQTEWAGRIATLSMIGVVTSDSMWFLSTTNYLLMTLVGSWAFILVTAIPQPGDVYVAALLTDIHDKEGMNAESQSFVPAKDVVPSYTAIDLPSSPAAPEHEHTE
jgi:hypothetical protein